MSDLTITVNDQEVAYLLVVLKKQPLENSYSIFNKISNQVREQQGKNEDSSGVIGS